jgi:methylenetetrahydrofolate dehydrogenase (NADP+) / methenyltetrahydrofolate cyclohydrolase
VSARLLDGTAIARAIREELRPRVAEFVRDAGRPPGLGLVLVGDDPASQVYVRNKLRAGLEAGFWVDHHHLPSSTTLDEIGLLVNRLNASEQHDAILVQSPLPDALGPGAIRQVFDLIAPAKDVDAFTPVNVGRLVQNRASLVSCTPAGIMELLDRSRIDPAGQRAVVVGRSDIVGKPMALLLMHRNATVSVCHSRTRDLPGICREADLLVAAIGRPGFVTRDFVKPGATVIDVGINRLSERGDVVAFFGSDSPRLDEFDRKGSVLIGDVHPAVADVAGAMTPVPGGVGPLTVAMLMKNTLTAALANAGRLTADKP